MVHRLPSLFSQPSHPDKPQERLSIPHYQPWKVRVLDLISTRLLYSDRETSIELTWCMSFILDFRAFADFLACNVVLHFAVANFLGWRNSRESRYQNSQYNNGRPFHSSMFQLFSSFSRLSSICQRTRRTLTPYPVLWWAGGHDLEIFISSPNINFVITAHNWRRSQFCGFSQNRSLDPINLILTTSSISH